MNGFTPTEIHIPHIGKAHAVGNLDLLNKPRAAILNSRQGKFPGGDASWIKKTLELVAELARGNRVIVSSTGMFTWELVTWKTGACGGKLILALVDAKPADILELISKIRGTNKPLIRLSLREVRPWMSADKIPAGLRAIEFCHTENLSKR